MKIFNASIYVILYYRTINVITFCFSEILVPSLWYMAASSFSQVDVRKELIQNSASMINLENLDIWHRFKLTWLLTTSCTTTLGQSIFLWLILKHPRFIRRLFILYTLRLRTKRTEGYSWWCFSLPSSCSIVTHPSGLDVSKRGKVFRN